MNRIAWTLIGLSLGFSCAAASAEVVAVVSAQSTLTTLSKAQVADIFLGRATRFPDGRTALPIDQAEGTGARDEFYQRVVGKSPAQIKAHWSKIIFTGRGQPPKIVSNSVETKKLISQNPNAIGYIDSKSVDSSVRVVLAL